MDKRTPLVGSQKIRDLSSECPDLSDTAKEENKNRREAKSIAQGELREHSKGKKIFRNFIADDAKNVKDYIIYDVIIPSIKQSISDLIIGSTEMILNGKKTNRSQNTNNQTGYVSYGQYRNQPQSQQQNTVYRRDSNFNDFSDVIFDEKWKADEALSELLDIWRDYTKVYVADLYKTASIETNFIHEQWGWTDLSDTKVRRCRYGWYVDLPRAIKLS